MNGVIVVDGIGASVVCVCVCVCAVFQCHFGCAMRIMLACLSAANSKFVRKSYKNKATQTHAGHHRERSRSCIVSYNKKIIGGIFSLFYVAFFLI